MKDTIVRYRVHRASVSPGSTEWEIRCVGIAPQFCRKPSECGTPHGPSKKLSAFAMRRNVREPPRWSPYEQWVRTCAVARKGCARRRLVAIEISRLRCRCNRPCFPFQSDPVRSKSERNRSSHVCRSSEGKEQHRVNERFVQMYWNRHFRGLETSPIVVSFLLTFT